MKPGAIETPNLFLLAGEREVTVKLQNALDLHEAFDESLGKVSAQILKHSFNFCLDRSHSNYAAAELILRFFEALPESIIPSDLFPLCIDASTNRDAAFAVRIVAPTCFNLLTL